MSEDEDEDETGCLFHYKKKNLQGWFGGVVPQLVFSFRKKNTASVGLGNRRPNKKGNQTKGPSLGTRPLVKAHLTTVSFSQVLRSAPVPAPARAAVCIPRAVRPSRVVSWRPSGAPGTGRKETRSAGPSSGETSLLRDLMSPPFTS